ncbi:oxidoreductase [Amycolatopsis antarctica]|uniref:Oxidoreductase n=1 Tax=Amycolatopsis antarctica TaxID=1854586 RepID=A0A263D920_9PSEU|nr:PDR/VanB family oxidoreductase [Amycolatopsis antarctica]OZM74980.1 oxidoreductase [Amycolatopsis antarctica]
MTSYLTRTGETAPVETGQAIPARRSVTRELTVHSVRTEAEGVVSLRLGAAGGGTLPAWRPGAHLSLHLTSGLVRQYSLCGDPDDRSTYRIAVLDEPNGRGGSAEVHRTVAEGVTVTVEEPRNHFELVPARRYLFVAGGIGITPILPMITEVARTGAQWSLLYGGRSRHSMAFLGELAGIPGGEVVLVPQDERGFPDLDAFLAPATPADAVYCCGPSGLIEAVERCCAARAAAPAPHVERFAAAPDAAPAADEDTDRAVEVELRRSGTTVTVPPGTSILRAVREVLPAAPWSCAEGYCGTCEATVLDGVPDHRDAVLSEDERAAGDCMMICVSRARTPNLSLDL